MFKFFKSKSDRIYLDHAAATPVDSRVLEVMNPYFSEKFFNPSSLYNESIVIARELDQMRSTVADLIHARPQEIIFTNGGTESNNLAIQGTLDAFVESNPETTPHLIVSAIEHEAVLETAQKLHERGLIMLDILPVNTDGIVEVKQLKDLLRPETVLVSVMYANNEIGTIQPIKEVTKTVRWFKKHQLENVDAVYPLVHTDAIQAVNYCDMHVARLGVGLMTVSSAKMYGPKGIAFLYVKSETPIAPVIFGGGQEKGLRSGTENMPLIAGLAKAFEITEKMKESEVERLGKLQKYFFEKLQSVSDQIIINGSREERLPNNINISIPGISSEQLVVEMDARRVACSSQSACSSRDDGESYVISALHPDADKEMGSLRFTMGRNTTKSDVDQAVNVFEKVLKKILETQQRFKK